MLRLYKSTEGGVFFIFRIIFNDDGGNQKRFRHISWKVAFEISLQLFAFRLALGITCKTDIFFFLLLYETSRYMFDTVFFSWIMEKAFEIIFGTNVWTIGGATGYYSIVFVVLFGCSCCCIEKLWIFHAIWGRLYDILWHFSILVDILQKIKKKRNGKQ